MYYNSAQVNELRAGRGRYDRMLPTATEASQSRATRPPPSRPRRTHDGRWRVGRLSERTFDTLSKPRPPSGLCTSWSARDGVSKAGRLIARHPVVSRFLLLALGTRPVQGWQRFGHLAGLDSRGDNASILTCVESILHVRRADTKRAGGL